MPGERRNLRSNKESASSTNGEKSRVDSQSTASSKDKPLPARTTSSKTKSTASKKSIFNSTAKDMSGDKPSTNGTEPMENGVNGVDDVDMMDDPEDKAKPDPTKDGEDEMTVVVPPPNSSKLSANLEKDKEGDVTMEDPQKVESEETKIDKIDPRVKAISGKWYLFRLKPVAFGGAYR